jgi:hypothetical protein
VLDVSRFVSQPFAGFPSQSPKLALHDWIVHCVPLQPAVAFASWQAVHAEPQVLGLVLSAQVFGVHG